MNVCLCCVKGINVQELNYDLSWLLTLKKLTSPNPSWTLKSAVLWWVAMMSWVSIDNVVTQVVTMMVAVSLGAPLIDNPYLSILINRRDVGHSFDLGVNRANHNLVITGNTLNINATIKANNIIILAKAPQLPMSASPGLQPTIRDPMDMSNLSWPSDPTKEDTHNTHRMLIGSVSLILHCSGTVC